MREFEWKATPVTYKNDPNKYKSATQNDVLTQFFSILSQPIASPRHFPQMLRTLFSETFNHIDGSGESQLLSYLQSLPPSPCSNTQGCQRAKTVSPMWPDSAVWAPLIFQQEGACCSHKSGTQFFLHWSLQTTSSHLFPKAFTFSSSLNFQLILQFMLPHLFPC